jgi:nucleotide-binding universal stress UspA family protein
MGTAFLWVIGAVLVVSGISTAIAMGRRGHSWFAWGVLGTALGPLVLFVAIPAIRREAFGVARHIDPGRPGSGPVHVLVGFDGSNHAVAVLNQIVALFGPRLGRVTLATVMEREYERTPAGREDERAVRDALLEAAASLREAHPETVVLTGSPPQALAEFAGREGFTLLAIGSRGRGLSKAMLGSVASRLAAHATVPVLIAGEERTDPAPKMGG